MKIEHVLFPSVFFFKITDPFHGRSFLMCSHDLFFGTNKNRILKNGSCERAFTPLHSSCYLDAFVVLINMLCKYYLCEL